MDKRTVSYVRTRFGDYYSQTNIPSLPEEKNRELAVIPWTVDEDPPMFRHKSALDYEAGIKGLLREEKPRHVYFSSAIFRAPSEPKMAAKGWLGADLVFDLDADHLRRVDSTDSYADRLQKVKGDLYDLLNILNDDFNFKSQKIVFSGGRGYHVHVRDEEVRRLDKKARKQIVEHIRGQGLSFADVTFQNPVISPVENPLTLKYHGGWGKRVHEHFVEFVNEIDQLEHNEAVEMFTEYDNIGEKKAEKLISLIERKEVEMKKGNFRIKNELKEFIKKIIPETIENNSSAIDEPVTTDTHRLIRVPGSLHGGTALKVVPLERDELSDFNPLIDAVPETFRGSEIEIVIEQDVDVELDENYYSFESGMKERVPEQVGIFLMSQGTARKA